MGWSCGSLCVARHEKVVYVQVRGLGSMQNSIALQKFASSEFSRGRRYLLVDLSRCRGVDSTFMGTLVAISQEASAPNSVIILNPSSHSLTQLRTVGIDNVLPIRQGTDLPEELELHVLDFSAEDSEQLLHHIYHAHKVLIRLDKRNEPKFRAFLDGLGRELGR